MNPEAVEWLESLTPEQHYARFMPAVCHPGFAKLKDDHDYCVACETEAAA